MEEELLRRHLGQVRTIAGQIRRKYRDADIEDLVAYGMLGLLKAIRGYDSTRGVQLKTYAEYRIRGEILDGLRSMRWLSRRACRKKTEYQQKMAAEEFRDTPDETAPRAEHLDPVPILEIRPAGLGELEKLAQETGWHAGRGDDPEAIFDRRQRLDMIAKAISRLPQRSREVIEMRYHRDLNWKEIGELLNERQSKLSQLHSRALGRLRQWLPRCL